MSEDESLRLSVRNFRSVRDQQVVIRPITVVYGPNGSGKSSLVYSLLTLKNIVLNPSQSLSGFFNYGFANLGGFQPVVHDHKTTDPIEFSLERASKAQSLTYAVKLHESGSVLRLHYRFVDGDDTKEYDFEIKTQFPYALNLSSQVAVEIGGSKFNVTWNGTTAQVQVQSQDAKVKDQADSLAKTVNSLAEFLRGVSVVPPRRGFTKPEYAMTSVTPFVVTEDEVATTLVNEQRYLEGRVSGYLETIVDRDLRIHVRPGTAIVSVDTTDKAQRLSTEVVNDGAGVGQLVFLLAKSLVEGVQLACVEEPEIHLHPTAVRRLASALVSITRDEHRKFVISTHSEALVLALLTMVAKGELQPEEVAFYFARKERRETKFSLQTISPDGQIEGGLATFMEGELEETRAFLDAKKRSGQTTSNAEGASRP